MFTGIVTAIGEVVETERKGPSLKRLAIAGVATTGLGAWSDLRRIAAAAALTSGQKAAGED